MCRWSRRGRATANRHHEKGCERCLSPPVSHSEFPPTHSNYSKTNRLAQGPQTNINGRAALALACPAEPAAPLDRPPDLPQPVDHPLHICLGRAVTQDAKPKRKRSANLGGREKRIAALIDPIADLPVQSIEIIRVPSPPISETHHPQPLQYINTLLRRTKPMSRKKHLIIISLLLAVVIFYLLSL